MKYKISIVSPVYGAEKILDELVNRIIASIEHITLDYEIILVEDFSPDGSWAKIKSICESNNRVRGIKLSRNFGQHYAITAGLDYAQGEWVVVMDCDLQDQPEEIPKLYNKALEGFDIVLARRHDRQDRYFKILGSALFYRSLGYLTGSKQDETIANFGVYNRKVISAVCSLRESIRYFPTMVKWVGFKSTTLNVEHASRELGSSSYNFRKLINLALDIILAYSDKPLRISIKFGLSVTLISILYGAYTLIRYFHGDIKVLGYSSLVISLWFLAGCIIALLGIVGLYVGKTFEGVKNRPIYVVDRTANIL